MMQARRKRIRWWLFAVSVGLALAWAWFALLRPLPPRIGPVPAALDDGWRLATPASVGIDDAALQRQVRALLDAPLDVHAVLVARHSRLVSEWYQGGLDRSVYALFSVRHAFGPTQRHDVRSIGKSVTSLLYGIALQEGRVPAPQTLVLDAYPALTGSVAPPVRGIRIQHLLDMASGLRWQEGGRGDNDEFRLFWKRDIPAYVFGHPMAQVPGTAFNYNGGGTAVLSDLISHGAGMPLDAYAGRRLFAPLGIRDWEWVHDLHGRPMAFNGLRLRPRDLLKIGQLVLDGGNWQGRQLVPRAWVEASKSARMVTGLRDFRYGQQWWSGTVRWQGRELRWFAGFGNGGQRLYVVPELDLAVVTTAGAYEQDATAIAVNDLIQQVVDCVQAPD